jgi:putative FmdB family regulatory protein
MPRYDYECSSCDMITELERPMDEDSVVPTCCFKSMNRIYSVVSVKFNGDGWAGKTYIS